jgi:micrococcal nuclease
LSEGEIAKFRKPFRAPPLKKRPSNVLQFMPEARQSKAHGRKAWLQKSWPYAVLIMAPFAGIGATWLWHETRTESAAPPAAAAEQYNVTLSRCSGPIRVTCVVDGDTIWLEGMKVRLADINTPEVSKPECPAELELGERATSRLVSLLNEGGFSLEPIDRDEDAYGLKLRILTRGGESLGATLVSEGLAEAWTGSRRSCC